MLGAPLPPRSCAPQPQSSHPLPSLPSRIVSATAYGARLTCADTELVVTALGDTPWRVLRVTRANPAPPANDTASRPRSARKVSRRVLTASPLAGRAARCYGSLPVKARDRVAERAWRT